MIRCRHNTFFVPGGVSKVDSPIVEEIQHEHEFLTYTLTFRIFIALTRLAVCLCQLVLAVNNCFGRKQKSFVWK